MHFYFFIQYPVFDAFAPLCVGGTKVAFSTYQCDILATQDVPNTKQCRIGLNSTGIRDISMSQMLMTKHSGCRQICSASKIV